MSRKDHDNYFYNYKFILLSILKTPVMCVHTSLKIIVVLMFKILLFTMSKILLL